VNAASHAATGPVHRHPLLHVEAAVPHPITRSTIGAQLRAAQEHPDAPPAQRPRTDAGPAPGAPGPFEGLASRPAGPTLPLTQTRADLWQWVRRPAHELLLDNTATLERTGVRDDARLLAPAPPPAHPSAASPAPNGLYMPSALPIPGAPAVRLPANEEPHVAAARRQVVDWLGAMRRDAAELHTEGASPDDEADAFRKLDTLALPAIVAALNAETPDLKLVYAHCAAHEDRLASDRSGFGAADWNAFVRDIQPGRWRVLLDNDAHGVALDVAVASSPSQSRPRVSAILLNPAQSKDPANVVAELADQLKLPADWSLLVAEVPAQKSQRSCKIFALSMALKCADGSFDALHLARMRGEPLAVQHRDIDARLARPDETDSEIDSRSSGYASTHRYSHGASDSDNDSDADSAALRRPARAPRPEARPAGPIVLGQEVLHAAQLVGPQFMKHAQSKADVESYIAARGPDATQPVNKQQQTLLERHNAHRVARWPAPTPPGFAAVNDGSLQIYSASIELKRISFLDKAIRHAAACDPNEVQALAAAMQTVDTRWKDRFA
jgi:hypothetical protein